MLYCLIAVTWRGNTRELVKSNIYNSLKCPVTYLNMEPMRADKRKFLFSMVMGGSGNLMERCYAVLNRVHMAHKSVWKRPERKTCLMDGYLCKEMDWAESGLIRSSGLTSLVFHRCLSFGSEVHFGRHSSSFLGRYIFKCPCSSTTRARQNRIFSTGFIPYWLARLPLYQSISLSAAKRWL